MYYYDGNIVMATVADGSTYMKSNVTAGCVGF